MSSLPQSIFLLKLRVVFAEAAAEHKQCTCTLAAIAQSPVHVVNDQAGRSHRQLPSEQDPYLLFSA